MALHFLVLGAILSSLAAAQDDYFRQPERLKSAANHIGENLGQYAYSFETEGGILQKEVGDRKYAGSEDETQLIQGSVQYNAPDGTPVAFSWTADEYGTRFSGSHIPTPPPIPPQIAKALEWLAKQPSTTEPPEYSQQQVRAAPKKPRSSPQQQTQFQQQYYPGYKNQPSSGFRIRA